ncbi:MAG: hypothetical protein Q8S73_36500, partial [Deltaproteobacteria bacterium]|nr:hypothetical protein [Deltaproteobacteria bacterium]
AAVVATASGGVGALVGDAGRVLAADAPATAIADAVAAAWDEHPAGAPEARERALGWRWEAQAEGIEQALWG